MEAVRVNRLCPLVGWQLMKGRGGCWQTNYWSVWGGGLLRLFIQVGDVSVHSFCSMWKQWE